MRSDRASTAQLATGRTRRLSTHDAAPAPVVLDRYRLTRRLGAGAFGTVWMARDERLERDVAVKILARERIVSGRFEREARAAARLTHPGIVTLYEAAVDDEGAYLVSELVIGDTLGALLESGRLSDRDIVAIAINLCDALAHAHAQGVVHRDVKPSNVLVPEAPPSATQLAKLTDFGVARVIDSDALTLTGDVLGTLAYMAPEQAAGLEAGAPADLFSLALVVYEALTGRNPVAHGAAARRARQLGAHLPPLRRQRRDLPRELGQGIDLALRPRPRERGSITDFRLALQAAAGRVSDEPGVVSSPWVTGATRPLQAEPPLEPGDDHPLAADRSGRDFERRAQRGRLGRAAAFAEPDLPPADAWPARAAGAVVAAALTAWIDVVLLAPSPIPPALAALIAGTATLLLPRLGWAALTIALCVSAVASHHAGAAVVLGIAGLLPVVLLPARATAWPLAAVAPALGMIGLAGAWPALAGRAGTVWRRAVLGAVGWLWLLFAAAISDRVLYLPAIAGAPSLGAWEGSVAQTVDPLLVTFVTAGVLAPAAVWGIGAAMVPWLARGRNLALDMVRVVIWAAMLAAATTASIQAAGHASGPGQPPSLVLGAVTAGILVLAPAGWQAWRRTLQSPGSEARVP
ncbi:MAG: serine/threonine-protein kinase [Solirubrobacteraceae bacterium]